MLCWTPATIQCHYSTIDYIPSAVPCIPMTFSFHNCQPVCPSPLHPFLPILFPSGNHTTISLFSVASTFKDFFFWLFLSNLYTQPRGWTHNSDVDDESHAPLTEPAGPCGEGAERESGTEDSKQPVCWQLRAQCRAQTHKSWDHDLSQSHASPTEPPRCPTFRILLGLSTFSEDYGW